MTIDEKERKQIIDGQKIEKIRNDKLSSTERKKDYTQIKVAECIDISESTYRNMIKGKKGTPLNDQIEQFIALANKLDSELIDFIHDEYEYRNQFFHIKLEDLENESNFNEYIHRLEKEYGRLAIFNTFPSSIYYSNNEYSQARYDFLSDFKKLSKKNITNAEYYPINMVINFSFNPCSRFSRSEKIEILDKIIYSFSKKEGNIGHDRKLLHIFNPQTVKYYHDAPTATYINNDIVLMPSPTHTFALLAIKSDLFAEELDKFTRFSNPKVQNTASSIEFLEYIRDSISENRTIHTFLEGMKEKTLDKAMMDIMKMTVENLSSDFSIFETSFTDR